MSQQFTAKNLKLLGDGFGAAISGPTDGFLELASTTMSLNCVAAFIDGDVSFSGNIISDLELPYNSITTQDIDVLGVASLTVGVYEKASGNFTTPLSGNSGFTIPVDQSGIILGTSSTSFSNWNFTDVDTSPGKVITVTLILNASTAYTYADTCSVNGVAVTGGVLWPQGVKPVASSGDDFITFIIVTDNTGVTKVYGSSILNYL